MPSRRKRRPVSSAAAAAAMAGPRPAALGSAAGVVRAGAYVSTEHGFAITLPDDWSQMSADELQDAAVNLPAEQSGHAVAGFTYKHDQAQALLAITPYPSMPSHASFSPN